MAEIKNQLRGSLQYMISYHQVLDPPHSGMVRQRRLITTLTIPEHLRNLLLQAASQNSGMGTTAEHECPRKRPT